MAYVGYSIVAPHVSMAATALLFVGRPMPSPLPAPPQLQRRLADSVVRIMRPDVCLAESHKVMLQPRELWSSHRTCTCNAPRWYFTLDHDVLILPSDPIIATDTTPGGEPWHVRFTRRALALTEQLASADRERNVSSREVKAQRPQDVTSRCAWLVLVVSRGLVIAAFRPGKRQIPAELRETRAKQASVACRYQLE